MKPLSFALLKSLESETKYISAVVERMDVFLNTRGSPTTFTTCGVEGNFLIP